MATVAAPASVAPPERVMLGRIVGVFGIRGWLKIQSYSRPTDNLLSFSNWWIESDGGYESAVVEVRPHGTLFVAQLNARSGEAIDDRNIAAKLVGSGVWVPLKALPKPPAGSYYWADLIGLSVESLSGVSLGHIAEMLDNGAQDVMVVKDGDSERLIPFVRGPIVQSVDLPSRTIVVDWEPDY